MDWLYVWSPRYEFFHEFLYSRIKDIPGFKVSPLFAEQHLFNKVREDAHFLAGISVKIDAIVSYVRQNIGKTFFFTDVDLIVMPSFQVEDLEPYKIFDITTMKEWSDNQSPNIGCLLIRCTEQTLTFFEGVQRRIVCDKVADQDAFIQELPSFPGTTGLFSAKNFLQSHMINRPDIDPYEIKIVQCIIGNQKPTDIIAEKICLIDQFAKIDKFLHYLPSDVQLLLYGKVVEPS